MQKYSAVRWVGVFFLVSLSYLLSFALTFGLINPIQNLLLPAYANFASLLFLPHGVRVITAWLYGWASLPLLAPSALLTHFYLYQSFELTFETIGALAGIFCAASSFWFLALLGLDFRIHNAQKVNWRDVMLAGAAASVLNTAWTMAVFGNDTVTASARFIGDLMGMFVSVVFLALIFRAIRRYK